MATQTQSKSKVTGTYVYCVMPEARAEAEKGSGALGASIDASSPVRMVHEDGLAAIVSDALRPKYEPSRANVGAHERIVHGAFEHGDILPIRFGSVAANDGAVAEFLRKKHDELEKSLSLLHGRAELAVKVLWDQNAIFKEILDRDQRMASMRDALMANPEAATQDQRVELGRQLNDAMEQLRKAEGDRIVERLRPNAAEVDVQRLLSEAMVLNAAFLVDRDALDAFDRAVDALAREQQGRLTFKYVGPLPPYSFVKISVPKEG